MISNNQLNVDDSDDGADESAVAKCSEYPDDEEMDSSLET